MRRHFGLVAALLPVLARVTRHTRLQPVVALVPTQPMSIRSADFYLACPHPTRGCNS
jgi:hypothetical protein